MKCLTKKLISIIGLIILLGCNQWVHAQSSLKATKVYDTDSLGYYNDQGRDFIFAADYEAGEKLLLELTTLGVKPQSETMRTWLFLGIIAHQQGLLNKSLQYYEASIDQYYQISEPSLRAQKIAANDLENIGNMYTRLGESQKAFLNLKSALKIAKEIQDVDLQITCLTNLGTATHTFGELAESIDYYKQALELSQTINKWDDNLATTHLVLSDVLLENDNEKEAEEHIKESIRVLTQLIQEAKQEPDQNSIQVYLQTYHEYLFQAYDALGQLYTTKDQTPQAIQAFQKAISYSEKAYQQRRSRELSRVYIHLAELFMKEERLNEALLACQDALGGVLPDMELSETPSLPDPNSFYPEFVLLEALSTQAYCAMVLYEKNGRIADLELAVESHTLANTAAQVLRTGIAYETDKLLLTEETHQRAEHALEAAYALYQQDPTEEHWQVGFDFMERSKANLLLEAFQDREARLQVGLPDSILDREEGLQGELIDAELAFRDLKLSESTSPEAINQAEENLYHARRDYDLFEEALEKNYPNYYRLKYVANPPTIEELRATLLQEGEAIIEFFRGDKYLYIFMLSKEESHFIRKENGERVSDLVHATLTSLTSLKEVEKNAFSGNAYQLYSEILAPLPISSYNRLIFIPDRELALIPFEALLTSEVKAGVSHADFPFLIKEHICSYAYSANLLFHTYTRERSGGLAKKSFLGMAPGTFPGTKLAPLPHTIDEISNLKSRLGGLALIGAEAQKEELLILAKDFQILHLSTHAMGWDQETKTAWIALSQGDEETAKVRLAELASLHLHADITVLSACETGTGQIERGEGVMSLARAFTFAGSQAILQSLWPVRPAAAAPLMEAFYEGLLAGKDKATALHEAKLQLLTSESPSLHAPIMWAAFAAIGDMRPVELKPVSGLGTWGWIGLVGLMLAFMMGFVWWKRRG